MYSSWSFVTTFTHAKILVAVVATRILWCTIGGEGLVKFSCLLSASLQYCCSGADLVQQTVIRIELLQSVMSDTIVYNFWWWWCGLCQILPDCYLCQTNMKSVSYHKKHLFKIYILMNGYLVIIKYKDVYIHSK